MATKNKDSSGQWKRLERKAGPPLKLFTTYEDRYINPRNEVEETMIVLSGRDSVNVIALTRDNQIVFVRQFRFGIEAETYELPGGLMEVGEQPEEAAKREMREETGYVSEDWSFLGKVGSNPVFIDSWVHHFVAMHAVPKFEMQLDSGEDINLVLFTLEEVQQRLAQGFFNHPHTVSALCSFFFAQRNK